MLVSICIPTYLRLNYLKQAVASAKAQTYSNIEICVSQNPTEHGPDKAIMDWCLEQEKIEIIRYSANEKNLGLTGNLNKLVTIATGDYVIFLGDDDLLHPDFVQELLAKSKNAETDVIFSNQFFINADGNILQDATDQLNNAYKRNELTEGLIKDSVSLVFNNSIPLSASLIKKELCKTYPFNEDLNTPELPFFLKVAINNGKFFYIKNQLAYYRLHNNSETSNGLATEELLKEIISVQVPAKYQLLKKNFIQKAIIPSVNKALIKGNYKLARFLLKSEYYPGKWHIKLVQKIMSFLPAGILIPVFKFRKAI